MTKPIKTWKVLLIYLATITAVGFSYTANLYPSLFQTMAVIILITMTYVTIRRMYLRQEFILSEVECMKAILEDATKEDENADTDQTD